MLYTNTSVERYGPPCVRISTDWNTFMEERKVVTNKNSVVGDSIGIVILKNRCIALAPSREAAS